MGKLKCTLKNDLNFRYHYTKINVIKAQKTAFIPFLGNKTVRNIN